MCHHAKLLAYKYDSLSTDEKYREVKHHFAERISNMRKHGCELCKLPISQGERTIEGQIRTSMKALVH